MQRDSVRRTMVPPQKELPLELGREHEHEHEHEYEGGGLPEKSSKGSLQAKLSKTGSSWSRQSRNNHVAVDGGDADEDGRDERQGEGQQPLVVLVAEDQLFAVEAKREELKRSRVALVAACCKVRCPRDARARGRHHRLALSSMVSNAIGSTSVGTEAPGSTIISGAEG